MRRKNFVDSRHNAVWFLLATTLAVGPTSALAQAQQKLNFDPLELVQLASKNEIKASDQTFYRMFRDTTQYKDHSVTREIVRTRQGGLSATLLINGRPLSAAQRQKDNDRLQKFANDANARRQQRKSSKADDQRAALMLASLPDAFLYTYTGTERGTQGEQLVHLKFQPNPKFVPPNRETAMYAGMNGDMIIDRDAMRIARIDGTLFKDVNFGWGILGRLYKGGRFIIVQRDVGGGDWEEVEETLQFTGRILLVKTLTIWSTETMTDFRPVPDNLTTAQALDLLQKSVELAEENGGVNEAQNHHK